MAKQYLILSIFLLTSTACYGMEENGEETSPSTHQLIPRKPAYQTPTMYSSSDYEDDLALLRPATEQPEDSLPANLASFMSQNEKNRLIEMSRAIFDPSALINGNRPLFLTPKELKDLIDAPGHKVELVSREAFEYVKLRDGRIMGRITVKPQDLMEGIIEGKYVAYYLKEMLRPDATTSQKGKLRLNTTATETGFDQSAVLGTYCLGSLTADGSVKPLYKSSTWHGNECQIPRTVEVNFHFQKPPVSDDGRGKKKK